MFKVKIITIFFINTEKLQNEYKKVPLPNLNMSSFLMN